MDTPSCQACDLATRNDKRRCTPCVAVPQECGVSVLQLMTLRHHELGMLFPSYDTMTINHMQLPQVLPFLELAHEPHIGRPHHRGNMREHRSPRGSVAGDFNLARLGR